MEQETKERKGMFGRRHMAGVAEPEALRNMELGECVALLGTPMMSLNLPFHRRAVAWKQGRRRVEIVFDEHHRAERVALH